MLVCVCMLKIFKKNYKICFMPYSITQIIKIQPPPKKTKAIKDKGGGRG